MEGRAKLVPTMKVFAVLIEIARRGGTAGVTELARALSMPKTTVYRVAGQLERLGYLHRIPGERRLTLSSTALEMAAEILQASIRTGPRHAALVSLSEQTGESCSLGVRAGYEIVYLDHVTGTSPLTYYFQTGRRAPLYCTSIGKLYLAKMTQKELEQFFKTVPLTRYTDWTVTAPDALREIIAVAAKTDFVASNQEFVLGVVGAAVPVRGRTGRMIAGLAVSIPAARMAYEDLGRLRPLLEETAKKLTSTFT
jgi:IclR family acetate operon transcriptional repressor